MKKSISILAIAFVIAVGGATVAQQGFTSPAVSGALSVSQLNQNVANQFAGTHVLATGAYALTFPNPFATTPACTASEVSTTGHYIKLGSISKTGVTFTSDVTTSNSDPVIWICVGNPR